MKIKTITKSRNLIGRSQNLIASSQKLIVRSRNFIASSQTASRFKFAQSNILLF